MSKPLTEMSLAASGSTDEVASLDAKGSEAFIKVAHTTELLEMILLEVDDVRTVLLSQRVSKTFKNTIQGSKELLHKLWFKTEYVVENEEPDFGRFASLPEAPDDGDFNPLLQKRINIKEDRLVWFEDDSAENNIIIHIHRNALFKRKEESWRRMLIFSCECAVFEIQVLFHWQLFEWHDTIDLEPTDTIQDLLDFVKEYHLEELEDEYDLCEMTESHKRWQAKLQSEKTIP